MSIKFDYILTDFFACWSVDYWKKGVEISNCNSGFVYFSLKFYQTFLMYSGVLLLGLSAFRTIRLSYKLTPLSLC